jgi:hypothetical protein
MTDVVLIYCTTTYITLEICKPMLVHHISMPPFVQYAINNLKEAQYELKTLVFHNAPAAASCFFTSKHKILCRRHLSYNILIILSFKYVHNNIMGLTLLLSVQHSISHLYHHSFPNDRASSSHKEYQQNDVLPFWLTSQMNSKQNGHIVKFTVWAGFTELFTFKFILIK